MADDWLYRKVRVARIGARGDGAAEGRTVTALIDTGASMTCVNSALVRHVYGTDKYPVTDTCLVNTPGGTLETQRVPLVIALELDDGQFVSSLVSCAIMELHHEPNFAVLLGRDVLSALSLAVEIDYKSQAISIRRYTWRKFEEEVAAAYRSLGGSVKLNQNLAGFQIDLLVEEETQSRQRLRLAVECKYYKEPVGNRIVNDFARVAATLKAANLADRGVIVSHAGYTQDASLVGGNTGLELLTLDDLRQQVAKLTKTKPAPIAPKSERKKNEVRARDTAACFVVMPFSPELDDVYHLGIREVVSSSGGSCERADELSYVGGIMEKIYDSIRRADVIIAEVTQPNPNVYYEIGFAHALGKPVVIITRDIKSSPFDLSGYNHIVYKSIVDLRNRLDATLGQLRAPH
jgi:nucleoside 2-deoxyribosyltransferase